MGDLQQELSEVVVTSAGQLVEVIKVQGDAHQRARKDSNGMQEWGSGSAAPDTNLYRSAADTLKTDDNLHVAGILSVLGGLGLTVTTATCATTGTAISNHGLTVLTSTTTKTYTLTAPVAGAVKALICTASGTAVKTVKSPSGVTVDGTNDDLTFNAANEAVLLVGASTSRWAVISNNGSVGIS